jgi:hypothetical protein
MSTQDTVYIGLESVTRSLKQYGVRGMRWGVRKRSGGSSTGSFTPSEDHIQALVAKTKPASSLSNTEMQSLITRMNLEQQYSRLATQAPAPTRGSKVTRFIGNLLADIGREQVTRVAKAQAGLKVEEILAKNGQKDLAKRITPKKK